MSREQKKLLRNKILEKRNSLTAQQIKEAERLIFNNLLTLDEYRSASNIFCYISFRSEVPTQAIIEYSKEQGKNIYIPVCVDETKEMIISKYDHDVLLEPSKYGVPEPSSDTIKISDRNILDAALMPGSVFDVRGYRVGYGAGYYDKFFSHTDKQIIKIALAYSFQVINEVPHDDFDVPVDCIVTEEGVIWCSRK